MERNKMPRENRAAQFAPFDALKGLQNALRIKEHEAERVAKGDLTEEEIKRLSSIVLSLEKGDRVKVSYYSLGHIYSVEGKVRLNITELYMVVGTKRIVFDDIVNIEILSKQND